MAEAAQGAAPGLTVHEHDCTLPTERQRERRFSETDGVIFGMPVYYGRIPALFHAFDRWQGHKTPAACVVTYGDRAYEDALLELKDRVTAHGFVPVAAAALVAQHSLNALMGAGRPNSEDLAAQSRFGASLPRLFARAASDDRPTLRVPGNSPYREYGQSPFIPVNDTALCTQCGICAACCPVQCIDQEDYSTSAPEKCICCRACIKYCPAEARNLPAPLAEQFTQRMALLAQMVKQAGKDNNRPEFFGI